MIYKHSYLKIFKALVILYSFTFLMVVFVDVVIVSGNSPLTFVQNSEVWLALLPKPVMAGLLLCSIGAFIVQWNYKCEVSGGHVCGRNTLGMKVSVNISSIYKTTQYNIPYIPIVRMQYAESRWSIWAVKSVSEKVPQYA